jgi:chromosomal replication initiator protein
MTDAPTIHDIQALVARRFHVTPLDLVSRRRARIVARPRQIAMWLCRYVTMHSLPEIGRAFGNRDHTTVMHAVAVVEERMKTDAEFGSIVLDLLINVEPVESFTVRRAMFRAVA